ncbi:hypothetical protein HXX76_015713 [Chlamydomonas incerta]|uniref:WSC domain-containing protein n=1 Tax=Chlamydomonas incerta TaxID=51695 RepID=A0A835SM08_CHLIN|nr:hypothetical protein HXX76_015713 [Chlamydomonas incerta]|eukprot:KAG2422885.1 hypothetical protein HXX76_015713 [Chlamydomonas incerta]
MRMRPVLLWLCALGTGCPKSSLTDAEREDAAVQCLVTSTCESFATDGYIKSSSTPTSVVASGSKDLYVKRKLVDYYLGCYKAFNSAGTATMPYTLSSSSVTVASCAALSKTNYWYYYGIINGTTCVATTDISRAYSGGNGLSNCTAACAGGGGGNCGGTNYVSLYRSSSDFYPDPLYSFCFHAGMDIGPGYQATVNLTSAGTTNFTTLANECLSRGDCQAFTSDGEVRTAGNVTFLMARNYSTSGYGVYLKTALPPTNRARRAGAYASSNLETIDYSWCLSTGGCDAYPYATDGIIAGTQGVYTLNTSDTQPWVMVDLSQVRLGFQPITSSTYTQFIKCNRLYASSTEEGTQAMGYKFTPRASNILGRYLTIQNLGPAADSSTALMLTEVEVYGTPVYSFYATSLVSSAWPEILQMDATVLVESAGTNDDFSRWLGYTNMSSAASLALNITSGTGGAGGCDWYLSPYGVPMGISFNGTCGMGITGGANITTWNTSDTAPFAVVLVLQWPAGSPAGVLFSMGRSPASTASQLVWRTDGISVTNPANASEEVQVFASALPTDVWSIETLGWDYATASGYTNAIFAGVYVPDLNASWLLGSDGGAGAVNDTTAPTITLVGLTELVIERYDPYVEYGATAYDDVDGVVLVRISMASAVLTANNTLNTSAVTPPGEPVLVKYTATDKAGNVAQQQRQVAVVDSCTDLGEFRCPSTRACSVFKMCGVVSGGGAGVVSDEYDDGTGSAGSFRGGTVADVTPPSLSLRVGEDGVAFVTPSGVAGVQHTVYMGSTFVDPGATALDEVPAPSGKGAPTVLDLTADVVTSIRDPTGAAVASISTAAPTGNATGGAAPFTITYNVADGAGNRAAAAVRLVYVVCRPPEVECPDSDGGSDSFPDLACSTNGVCGVGNTLGKGAADAASGSSSSSSSSAGSGSNATRTANATSEATPRFELLGASAVITVPKGAVLEPCREGSSGSGVCEPGYRASLSASGDLNSQVVACKWGSPAGAAALPFRLAGLRYCGINTTRPDTYNITYHLEWPSLPLGEVVLVRFIVVEPGCDQGERVCAGTRQCSVDGVCPGESVGNGTAAAATRTNQAPSLELAVTPELGLSVSVPRGIAYKLCAAGQSPTAVLPCEPLGIATDQEDGNLSSQIALCPPSTSSASSCVSTQCRAHWPDRKQPADCGIDTLTGPIGTTFRLRLAVYDSAGANTTAERVVTVVSPCAAGKYYCPIEGAYAPDGSQSYECLDMSCGDNAALQASVAALSANETRAHLYLLPALHSANLSQAEADQAIRLAYRQPAGFSLAPCASYLEGTATAAPTCAAVAFDATYANDGDITSDISTLVEVLCSSSTTNSSGCSSGCSLVDLSLGYCLPGRYRVNYSVKGALGDPILRRLTVTVEQVSTSVLEFGLYPGGSAAASNDTAVAQAYAAALQSNSSFRDAALLPPLRALGVSSADVRSLSLVSAPEVVNVSSPAPAFVVRVRVNLTVGTSTPVADGGSSSSSRRRGLSALSPSGLARAWTGGVLDEGMDGQEERPDAADVQPSAAAPSQDLVWLPTAHSRTASPQQRLVRAEQDLSLAMRLLQAAAGEAADDDWNTNGGDSGSEERGEADARVRRLLQSASGACTAPAALSAGSSSNASAAAGLASFSALGTSCSTPSINSIDVALGVLIGAINDLISMDVNVTAAQSAMGTAADGIDAAETRLAESVKSGALDQFSAASSAFDSVEARATTLSRLLDRTLALQADNAAAMLGAIDILQTVLNEAEGATQRAEVTTAVVLDGLGLLAGSSGSSGNDSASTGTVSNETATYLECVYGRAEAVPFYFSTNKTLGANATAAAQNLSSSTRRQLLTALREKQLDEALLQQRPAPPPAWQAPRSLGPSSSSSSKTLVGSGVCRLIPSQQHHSLGPDAEGDAPGSELTWTGFLTGWLQRLRATTIGAARRAWCPAPAGPVDFGGNAEKHDAHRVTERSVLTGGGGTSTGRGGSGSGSGSVFAGYSLPEENTFDYSLYDVRNLGRPRFAGLNNRILGGILLHQVRHTSSEVDASLLGAQATAGSCQPQLYGGRGTTGCAGGNGTQRILASGSDLGGIGVDPVFIKQSPLFQPSLDPAAYYNTSNGSVELNPAGVPYGFFHHPLGRHFPAGYPVLLDTRLSALRAEQALLFLRDGRYLSATLTKSVRAQVTTYNPDARVFGYFRMDFAWSDSGDIDVTVRVLGLPAVSYGESIRQARVEHFLPDFFLVLLAAGYTVMAAYDIMKQLRHQREERELKEVAERQKQEERRRKRRAATLRRRRDDGRDPSVRPTEGADPSTSRHRSRSSKSGDGGGVRLKPSAAARLVNDDRETLSGSVVVLTSRAGAVAEAAQPAAVAGAAKGIASWLPSARHPDKAALQPPQLVGAVDSSGHGQASSAEMADEAILPRYSAGGDVDASRAGVVSSSSSDSESDVEKKRQRAQGFVKMQGIDKSELRFQHRSYGRLRYQPRLSPGWVLLEVATVAFMWAAIGIYFTYTVQLSVKEKFQGRYDVYDSDTYSPARYFLLRRGSNTTSNATSATAAEAASAVNNATLNATAAAAAAAAATAANVSELLGNSTRRLLATATSSSRLTGVTATSASGGLSFSTATSVLGGSGLTGNDGTGSRWSLPQDSSQLEDAGDMFSRVDDMYDNLVLYGLLQSFALAMIILRWVHHISFQARLSVILGSLVAVASDLLYLAIVVVIMCVMFAAAACIGFGYSQLEVSSYGDAVYLLLKYAVLMDDGGVLKRLVQNRNGQYDTTQGALAALLYALCPLFFGFVMLNFILAILLWPFPGLKFAVRKQPSIPQASLAKDAHVSLLAKVSSHVKGKGLRELRGDMRRLWARFVVACCSPHKSDDQDKGMIAALEALDEARGQHRAWQLHHQPSLALQQRSMPQPHNGKLASALAAADCATAAGASDAGLSKFSDPSASMTELHNQQHQSPGGKGRLKASLRPTAVMPLPPPSSGPGSSAGMASPSYWKGGGAAKGAGIGSPDLGQCGSVGSMDVSADSAAIRNATIGASVVTVAALHVGLHGGDSATGSPPMLLGEARGADATAAGSGAAAAVQEQQHLEALAASVLDNLVRRLGARAVSKVPKKLKWGKHRTPAGATGQAPQSTTWLEPPTDVAMLRPVAQTDIGGPGAGGLSAGKFTPFANTRQTWDGEPSYGGAGSSRLQHGAPALSAAGPSSQRYTPASARGAGSASGALAMAASGSMAGSGSDSRGHGLAAGSVTLPIMPAMAPGLFPDAATDATEPEQLSRALSPQALGHAASCDVSTHGGADGGVPSSVLHDAADVPSAAYGTGTGGAVDLSENPNFAAVLAMSLAADGAGGALNHTPSWTARLAARAPSLSSPRPSSPRGSYSQQDLASPVIPGPTAAAAATSPVPMGAERPPSAIRMQRTTTLGAGASAAGAAGGDRPPSAMRGTRTSTLGAGAVSRAFTAPSIPDAEAEPDLPTQELADESHAHLAAWPSQHKRAAAAPERPQSRGTLWAGGAAHAPSRLARGSVTGGGTPRASAGDALFGPGPLFAPVPGQAAVAVPLPAPVPAGVFATATAAAAPGDDADGFLDTVMAVDSSGGSDERAGGQGAAALGVDGSTSGRRAALAPGSARSRAAVRTLPTILSAGGAPEQEEPPQQQEVQPVPDSVAAVTAVRLAAPVEEVDEDEDEDDEEPRSAAVLDVDEPEPQAAAAHLPSRRWAGSAVAPPEPDGTASGSAGPVAEAREHRSRSRLLPRASPALDTSPTGAAAAAAAAGPPPVEQSEVEEVPSWRPAAAPVLPPRKGANMAAALSRIESLIAQLRELVWQLQAATADVTAMSAAVARWTEAAALVAVAAAATGQLQAAAGGPERRVFFLLQLRAVLAALAASGSSSMHNRNSDDSGGSGGPDGARSEVPAITGAASSHSD